MTTQNTAEKLKQVQRYSTSLQRLFKFLFALGAIAVVIAALLILTGAEPFDANVRIGSAVYSGDSISGTIRVIAIVGLALGAGIALKLNFHLIKLFGLYAQGDIFTADNVRQIRQIGITVLLIPALWLLGVIAPLLVGVAAYEAGSTTTTFMMILPSTPFDEVIAGTIIIVISWIMDVGRELREEQDLVV
jgi:hypothetical protein